MKTATLVFLINKQTNQICLGMKKRGFATGKWNGFGGKVQEGESIEEAALRELIEESGVKVSLENLTKVAVLNFVHQNKEEGWNQTVHVFTTYIWDDQPIETEEMKPQWFDISNIPYNTMWPDDAIWLPKILNQEKLKATFFFSEDEIINHEINHIVNF